MSYRIVFWSAVGWLRVEGDADRALGAAVHRAVREAAMGGRVSIVAG
jgi:hypothetical protein